METYPIRLNLNLRPGRHSEQVMSPSTVTVVQYRVSILCQPSMQISRHFFNWQPLVFGPSNMLITVEPARKQVTSSDMGIRYGICILQVHFSWQFSNKRCPILGQSIVGPVNWIESRNEVLIISILLPL